MRGLSPPRSAARRRGNAPGQSSLTGGSLSVASFELLRAEVVAASTSSGSPLHGELHWRSVAWAGLQVARGVPSCRPNVVLLFALFHDAMRQNDVYDPEHGRRGATLVERLHGTVFRVDDEELRLLLAACRNHADGRLSDDPTIGTCWDADRLNLWRFDVRPMPELLSTAPARDPVLIEEAATFHRHRHRWTSLAAALLEEALLRRERPREDHGEKTPLP